MGRKIATGGFGTVYLAEMGEGQQRRQVIVKKATEFGEAEVGWLPTCLAGRGCMAGAGPKQGWLAASGWPAAVPRRLLPFPARRACVAAQRTTLLAPGGRPGPPPPRVTPRFRTLHRSLPRCG